jgi:hypothetical protein
VSGYFVGEDEVGIRKGEEGKTTVLDCSFGLGLRRVEKGRQSSEGGRSKEKAPEDYIEGRVMLKREPAISDSKSLS